MAWTKASLAHYLEEHAALPFAEAEKFVEVFFDEISKALIQGESVHLSGFGNFNLRDKKERPARNPKTGKAVMLSRRRVVTYLASQKFKKMIRESQV